LLNFLLIGIGIGMVNAIDLTEDIMEIDFFKKVSVKAGRNAKFMDLAPQTTVPWLFCYMPISDNI